MFIQHHLIILLTTIYPNVLAVIHDETYIAKNGPFGLIFFKKNDTFVDWIRVPEIHYKQWIYALKVWRTCSIVLGILSLVFAALILAYIIHGFHTDSSGPFDCFGEGKPDDGLLLSHTHLPINFQQFPFQQQLKRVQQQQQQQPQTKI